MGLIRTNEINMANQLCTLLSLILCFHLAACQPVAEPTTNDARPAVSFSPLNPITTALPQTPLFISHDYGQSWEDASYNLPADLQVSFIEQQGEELVIASDNLGVFKSSNNRTHWTAIGASLPSSKINALHINGDDIYVGVFQKGIFKTTDDGQNWQSLNEGLPNLTVQSIYQFEDRVLVGTDIGLFYQDPDSQQWQPTGLKVQVLSLYEQDKLLIAGTQDGTALSHTEGTSWEWIHRGEAVHYTHPVGSRIVELVLTGDLNYSDDWGKSWNSILYGPREGSYVYEIIPVGTYQLMSNNYGVHRSTDSGQSWQLIFPIEQMAFFDFLVVDETIYGGTRVWDEFRGRD